MSASIVRLPLRDRLAVHTCPATDQWHVTCCEVGTGAALRHRVYFKPHHACNLLSLLEPSQGYRIVLSWEAELWRHLLYNNRPLAAGGAA